MRCFEEMTQYLEKIMNRDINATELLFELSKFRTGAERRSAKRSVCSFQKNVNLESSFTDISFVRNFSTH